MYEFGGDWACGGVQFEEVPLGEVAELPETGLCKATPLGGPCPSVMKVVEFHSEASKIQFFTSK